MGFPRQEYWTGLPFLSPRDLPDPGIQPTSPSLAGELFTAELPGRPQLTAILLYTLLEVRHTWGNTWAETDTWAVCEVGESLENLPCVQLDCECP